MEQRETAFFSLLAVVIMLILAAGVWYIDSHQNAVNVFNPPAQGMAPSASSLSFSCPQNSRMALVPYESAQIAFCYPSDLTVGTDSLDRELVDLNWPEPYMDISYGKIIDNPTLRFGIVQAASDSIVAHVSGCDFSGPNGDDVCLPPQSSQIATGTNPNGLNYMFYRTAFVANGSNVISSSTGPYAYLSLTQNKYLIFQPHAGATLPPYVDSDLREILNTVDFLSVATSTGTGI